jgi:DNA repair protein RecO (recombination protein O)
MIEKTNGIILGGLKYGDTSKIIRIYTPEYGKISFIAKGVYNKKNPYGAALEVISISDITYYSKSNGLHLLSKAELSQYHSKIINNSELLLTATSAIELINTTQPDNAKNEALFNLTKEFLSMLNSKKYKPFNLLLRFMLEFCSVSGFELDLFLPENDRREFYYFSLNDGAFLLGGFTGKRFSKLNSPTAKKLIDFYENNADVKFDNYEKNEVINFLLEYLSFHYEKGISINSLTLLI